MSVSAAAMRQAISNPYVRIALGVVLFVFLCAALTLFAVDQIMSEGDWNPAMIERSLGVAIPVDALEVHYEGSNRNGAFGVTYLHLTFKAAPDVMTAFTSHFCDGVLHERYDPFHAVNKDDRINSPFAIRVTVPDPMLPSSYYSYSPKAPETVFGNQCLNENLVNIKFSVDQSNPVLYALHLTYSR